MQLFIFNLESIDWAKESVQVIIDCQNSGAVVNILQRVIGHPQNSSQYLGNCRQDTHALKHC